MLTLLLSVIATKSIAQSDATPSTEVLASTSCFCALPMLDERVQTPICSLQDLPDSTRQELVAYLLKRVGSDVYSHLRVDGGRTIDMVALAELDNQQKTDWYSVTSKYSVCFAYHNELAGIKDYIAIIGLNEQGKVLKDIPLPDVAHDSSKSIFIDANKVWKLARQAHIPAKNISRQVYVSYAVSYVAEINSLVWKISSRKYLSEHRVVERKLIVNAHTGEVLRSDKYRRWVKNDI